MDDNDTFGLQNPKLSHQLHEQLDEEQQDDDEYEDGDGDEDDQEDDEEEELETSVLPVGAQFMELQPQALSAPSSIMLSETDQHAKLAVSSSPQQLLTDMAAVNSFSSGGVKEKVGPLHQDVFTVTVPCAEFQTENQLDWSISGPTRVTVIKPKPSPDLKAVASVPIMKTPTTDGYNWRKYGQKQVKSTKGSRSYYKCTYSECCSKKIECSDHSGGVIETIYKGTHGHEPPRKSNHTKESRLAASADNDVGNSLITHPVKTLNNPIQPCSSREPIQETSLHECKRQKSSESDRTGQRFKDEQVVEPELKQRLKKGGAASPGSVLKPDKKSKLVVHGAGDVGISSDGYRWRKYGQKMVKGNPHPRNYYRCTSAGCPVRKHIEMAMDNTNALIIIYKGVHDHDMPVPKKRHGPPSASIKDQIPSTNWSLGTKGELMEAQDLGIEKTVESARTLLSIGFEIKPC